MPQIINYLWKYANPIRQLEIRRRPVPTEPTADVRVVLAFDLEISPWLKGTEISGLNNLMNLLNAYGISATFLTEGVFAEAHKSIVEDLFHKGHEIGSHGWHHESYGGFWYTSTETQPEILNQDGMEDTLRKCTDLLRDITGVSPDSFVAPFHLINRKGLDTVAGMGFKVDSSTYNHTDGYKEPILLNTKYGNLVEMPFTTPIHPIWRKRYSAFFPTLLDAACSNPNLILKELPLSFSKKKVILITCHPWEFNSLTNVRFKTLTAIINALVKWNATFIQMKDLANWFT